MGINTKIIQVLLLMVLGCMPALGQIRVRLVLKTYDFRSPEGAELLVQQGDSVVAFSIIKDTAHTPKRDAAKASQQSKGREHVLTLPHKGRYKIQIAHPLYSPYEVEETFSSDSVLSVVLEKRAEVLGEVVVQGKTSPKLTATGEVFWLSQRAKASGDPFRALSEIPLLDVDVVNQVVRMSSGGVPLVLVDGRLVNTGIAPIHPENIESVEISEVVSARYLQMGVTKMINIRLKERMPMFTYVDVRSRHDVPLLDGFGSFKFEVGSKKIALAGDLLANYKTNDHKRDEVLEQMLGRTKELSGRSTGKGNGLSGHLYLKYAPSKEDYFSAYFRFNDSRSRTNGSQVGTISSSQGQSAINASSKGEVRDGGVLGSLYYEHVFKDKSTLSGYFKYNRGFYDIFQSYEERFGGQELRSLVDLGTSRDQYTASIDYFTSDRNPRSWALGYIWSIPETM